MASRAKLITGAVVAVMLATSGAASLFAQDMPPKIDDKEKAAAAAKDRLTYMRRSLGANERVLIAVMRGQEPLDDKAIAAAEKIHASTEAKEILSHFNPGTGDDVVEGTLARALIWSEWDKVKGLASAVQPAAAATLAAARAGDQAAFATKEQATVNACNACHEVYRKPRQR